MNVVIWRKSVPTSYHIIHWLQQYLSLSLSSEPSAPHATLLLLPAGTLNSQDLLLFMHFGWESWRKMIITSYIPIRIVWTKKKLYGYWRITKDIAVYYIRQLVLQNEQIVFINFFRFRICNYIYAFFFCLTNSQKKLFACFHLTHAALETILESDK